MEDPAKSVLITVINSIFHDAKRNPVCRIFIPGDTRMFDKFVKTLKQHADEAMIGPAEVCRIEEDSGVRAAGAGSAGTAGAGTETVGEENVLKAPWFLRYLRYQMSLEDVYNYALKYRWPEVGEEDFLTEEVKTAALYGEECFAVVVGEADRRQIREFYRLAVRIVSDTMKELEPVVDSRLVEGISGTEEEVRGQVIRNLKRGKLKNDEMWWHIRYCIDHGIRDEQCQEILIAAAKRNWWKAWVRQAAVEYACRTLSGEELYGELLPWLYGKLFYWAVEQLMDRSRPQAEKVLRDYAGWYNGQEMSRDALLVKMQDKESLDRVGHYLDKMRRITNTIEYPDVIQAVGEVRDIRLLDELEDLLDLTMKENFRDRRDHGLRVALVSALAGTAAGGARERQKVLDMLDRKCTFYEGKSGKEQEEQLHRMAADVRWRCGRLMEAGD